MVAFKALFKYAPALVGLSSAAQLEQVTEFGDNPAGVRMFIYVPDNVAANPAVIVAIHYCTGSAEAYYQGSQFATLAEEHGFIVVYPESPYDGGCWDVSSDATLTHNGGGDSNSIANMVAYTIDTYQADSGSVFATGTSSGAMMTVSKRVNPSLGGISNTKQNVLAATYPEEFQAGAVHAGVAAGCFYTGTVNGWNSTCSDGEVVQTPDAWAAVAHNMYPNYTGEYPRMAIYHGSADEILDPQNYEETIKQWAGIFGYDTEPDETLPDDPEAPFTKEVFGPNLFGSLGEGIPHNLPIFETADLEWFGII